MSYLIQADAPDEIGTYFSHLHVISVFRPVSDVFQALTPGESCQRRQVSRVVELRDA